MVLSKLKPGMTVYSVKKSTGLSRFNGKWQVWPVVIKEVDEENNRVLASWNGNKADWYYQHTWSKWRMKIPK